MFGNRYRNRQIAAGFRRASIAPNPLRKPGCRLPSMTGHRANLADPEKGAAIELRHLLGTAKLRKVPVTLAGPRFTHEDEA